MKKVQQHIETAVVSGPPGTAFGPMYSMHKYWSKKSPQVVSSYIERYTEPGDIVLDPFCGSGITACEAVRLGRRAIAIDLNPVATFIAKTTLTPVNLSRLGWAFRDIGRACEGRISELFRTTCPCCKRIAVAEFVVRERDDAKIIAYRCECSDGRLFKDADKKDKQLDRVLKQERVPYWYPRGTRLPPVRKSQCRYVHELFTRRNLVALSLIHHFVEAVCDVQVRNVLRLAFTAALDKCSRLMPLSPASLDKRPTLQQGWIAVRFYTPPLWQEVNPWYAFERSFRRVYEGKKDSNDRLKSAVLGSTYKDIVCGKANALVLTGSADEVLDSGLPKRCVDYVLTDPPFGDHIQYLALSTFWGAWLGFDLQYEKELVVAPVRGKGVSEYERQLGRILSSIRDVMRTGEYIHLFWEDVQGPYLHKLINLMAATRIMIERVLHQPPPSSFAASARARDGAGPRGSYVVRGRAAGRGAIKRSFVTREMLCLHVGEAVKMALAIRGGRARVPGILHSVYQKLGGQDLLSLAKEDPEKFLAESVHGFAKTIGGEMLLETPAPPEGCKSELEAEVKTAWLDARSLYMNEGNGGKDVINQVRQRVLYRFQDKGLTLEDIGRLGNISEDEVKIHRQRRLTENIRLFGQALGFLSSAPAEPPGVVEWQGRDGAKVSFEVGDCETLVRASRVLPEGDVASEIGTIFDADWERALREWSGRNSDKGSELTARLFPMGEPSDRKAVPRQMSLQVLENRELVKEEKDRCQGHYLIELAFPPKCAIELQPGQFFHFLCDPDGDRTKDDKGKPRGYSLTLRRPLSTHRIHYRGFNRRLLATRTMIPHELKKVIKRPISKIDFLYKVVGIGTSDLSRVHRGMLLPVIGPLGNGFSIEAVDLAIIVAGGIGVAPLVALAERLRYLGTRVVLYLGAMKRELLCPILSGRPDPVVEDGYADGTPKFLELIESEFREIGAEQVVVCTDDASVGERGSAADILARDLKLKSDYLRSFGKTVIYACGPYKMLKSVSGLARNHGIHCQVLLEERMACGVGACLSCTCSVRGSKGRTEKRRVCVDGPVFDSEAIIWQD